MRDKYSVELSGEALRFLLDAAAWRKTAATSARNPHRLDAREAAETRAKDAERIYREILDAFEAATDRKG